MAELIFKKLNPQYAEFTVTISKEFNLRLAIALFLIKVAGWVLGCRTKIENE